MSLLSRLNKPITLSNSPNDYVTSSRPVKEEETMLLNRELDLLRTNNKINWGLPRTYIPSLLCSIFIFLIFKSFVIATISFIVFFIILKVIPSFLNMAVNLLKRDIAGGVVYIKKGPVTITTDDLDNTYMKRSYLDDVIIDGVYNKEDSLKYPDLVNGQSIEVVYSPNAQYIFLVRSL